MPNEVPNEIVIRLREEMLAGYEKLFSIAQDPSFQRMLDELYGFPPNKRPRFVSDVIMNPEERLRRGVHIPDDVLVLRSAFGDRRPTLFCLKKYLSRDLHKYWQNVNLTFDNPADPASIPTDARAWRKPLQAEIQAAAIESGLDIMHKP
jgi:hypothetical protein